MSRTRHGLREFTLHLAQVATLSCGIIAAVEAFGQSLPSEFERRFNSMSEKERAESFKAMSLEERKEFARRMLTSTYTMYLESKRCYDLNFSSNVLIRKEILDSLRDYLKQNDAHMITNWGFTPVDLEGIWRDSAKRFEDETAKLENMKLFGIDPKLIGQDPQVAFACRLNTQQVENLLRGKRPQNSNQIRKDF